MTSLPALSSFSNKSAVRSLYNNYLLIQSNNIINKSLSTTPNMAKSVEVTSPEMWGLPASMFHETWKTFLIHFHKFAELPTTKGRSLESPEFTCNDQKWSVSLYPGGDSSDYSNNVALLFSEACCFTEDMANSGYVSLYLNHRSRGNATATFEVKIINKYGDTIETRTSSNNRLFDMKSSNSGWGDIIRLSDIFDATKDILDSNGTLTVAVSIMPASVSSSESKSAPKLTSATLGESLPREPSWMKPPVVVGTLSNEGIETDLGSYQSESIDSGSTQSVDPLDQFVQAGSLVSNLDAWTDPGRSDCRDDDEVSNESLNEVISITSPEMCGLPKTMFHKEWKSFLIHFPNFAKHSISDGHRLESPEFTCNGQKWALRLYPGGNTSASDTRYVALYLNHRSRGSATATFEVKIVNKYGDTIETRTSSDNRHFDSSNCNSGWNDIIKLSDILDESKDILDKNSTLTVVVSMKQEPIPAKKHPTPIKKTPMSAKKTQLKGDPQSDLALKKLVLKCLLNNQLLQENATIGSRGRNEALKLQSDPSLASVKDQQELPTTRDPPETVCSAMQPERHHDVRTVQFSSGVLNQPPRPEEVRYQLHPGGNLQPPASVCTATIQNDFYSSQKSYSSAPTHCHNIGQSGLSSQAMERRRHYKEMILQQQLSQTQAQLAQAQRLLARDPYSITA